MEWIWIKNQTGRIKEIAEKLNALRDEFSQVSDDFYSRRRLLFAEMNKECQHPVALFGGGYTCTACGIKDDLDAEGIFQNFRNTVFKLDLDEADRRENPDDVAFETKDGKVTVKRGPSPFGSPGMW